MTGMDNPPWPVSMAFEVHLDYQVNTAGADFIFNIQAARTARQRVVSESLFISQAVPRHEDVEPTVGGRFLRLRADAGPLQVRYNAVVQITHHWAFPASIPETWVSDLPGPVLPYLYPSRYCESDRLNAFAMKQFGSLWQGYARVQAICEWVQTHIKFQSGSSSGTTSATETLEHGAGVCRDFAHLMIALCRAVNIPARFTTGFDYGADPALGPPDFHAYVEAYVGHRWYLFDPSGTAIPMGFVRLTSGRDAADSAFSSIFGDVTPAGQHTHIEAVADASGMLRQPYRCTEALSTHDGP